MGPVLVIEIRVFNNSVRYIKRQFNIHYVPYPVQISDSAVIVKSNM